MPVPIAQPKGTSEEILTAGLNNSPEFNQYLEYYAELLQAQETKRVLIIEDDPFSQKLLESSIASINPHLKCFHASTAQEVFNILKLVPCHLVISDYFLHGSETGLEICRRIQELYPEMKCVIVSQLKFEKFKEIAKSGPTAPPFIEKPLSPKAIERCINNIFIEGNNGNRKQ